MKPIDLMLDEENELRFKVNIEGSRPGKTISRLVLEAPEMSLIFEGEQDSEGELVVIVPELGNVLKEGTYDSHLEVLVDDRIFVPLELKTKFEKSVSVTAEAIVRTPRRKPKVNASAVLVESQPNVSVINSKTSKISESKERKRKDNVITDKDIQNLFNVLKRKKK